jgi:hypothetical protein
MHFCPAGQFCTKGSHSKEAPPPSGFSTKLLGGSLPLSLPLSLPGWGCSGAIVVPAALPLSLGSSPPLLPAWSSTVGTVGPQATDAASAKRTQEVGFGIEGKRILAS